jgi:hypothetical protein
LILRANPGGNGRYDKQPAQHPRDPRRVIQTLSYKAREAGIEIVKVNVDHVDLQCGTCGWVSASGATSIGDFLCGVWGEITKPDHADLSTARNIAQATGDALNCKCDPGELPGLS